MPIREWLAAVSDVSQANGEPGHTLENTDGSGEIVDAAGGLQGSSKDLNGGNEIVGKAVVKVSLDKYKRKSKIDQIPTSMITHKRRTMVGLDRRPVSHMGSRLNAYLELENILHTLEFLLKSINHNQSQHLEPPVDMCNK